MAGQLPRLSLTILFILLVALMAPFTFAMLIIIEFARLPRMGSLLPLQEAPRRAMQAMVAPQLMHRLTSLMKSLGIKQGTFSLLKLATMWCERWMPKLESSARLRVRGKLASLAIMALQLRGNLVRHTVWLSMLLIIFSYATLSIIGFVRLTLRLV